jgi:hypothetical protein
MSFVTDAGTTSLSCASERVALGLPEKKGVLATISPDDETQTWCLIAPRPGEQV